MPQAYGLEPQAKWQPMRLPFLFGIIPHMHNDAARQIGEELKGALERLRALAKAARAARSAEAEAIDMAVVNLDSAIEILTE